MLSHGLNFEVNSLLNPFSSTISTDIILPNNGILKMNPFDGYGKLVGRENKDLTKGLNKVSYYRWSNLSKGIYFISFEFNNVVIQKKLTKVN